MAAVGPVVRLVDVAEWPVTSLCLRNDLLMSAES